MLQCLHIFWFYLISRMIYKLMIVGSVEKDVRSDDEEESMEDYDTVQKKKTAGTGTGGAAGAGAAAGGSKSEDKKKK